LFQNHYMLKEGKIWLIIGLLALIYFIFKLSFFDGFNLPVADYIVIVIGIISFLVYRKMKMRRR